MIKDESSSELIVNNAGMLSKSQYEAIVKSDEVTDEFRKKLAQKRGEQIKERLIADNKKKDTDTLAEVIGKADTSELEALGFEEVKKVAGKLSAKQIDDWKDLTPTEKNQLKAERKTQLIDEFKQDSEKFFERVNNDEERSKLPATYLDSIPELPEVQKAS